MCLLILMLTAIWKVEISTVAHLSKTRENACTTDYLDIANFMPFWNDFSTGGSILLQVTLSSWEVLLGSENWKKCNFKLFFRCSCSQGIVHTDIDVVHMYFTYIHIDKYIVHIVNNNVHIDINVVHIDNRPFIYWNLFSVLGKILSTWRVFMLIESCLTCNMKTTDKIYKCQFWPKKVEPKSDAYVAHSCYCQQVVFHTKAKFTPR